MKTKTPIQPLEDEVFDAQEMTASCDVMTVFLCTICPELDEDQVFTLMYRIFDDGGVSLDNAVEWGQLIASTKYGRASDHLM